MPAKKRRGRPTSSKKQSSKLKAVSKMELRDLQRYIDRLEKILARKVQQQRTLFEGKISELSHYAGKKADGASRALTKAGRSGKRKKATPKYQSKKKKGLKWSGRGLMPVWMRDEMKETNLKKDDFLIH
jgi:DNA-binding protein H-NS